MVQDDFEQRFRDGVRSIVSEFDWSKISRLAGLLAETRSRSGRAFVLGLGGSAANASHFVNDLRKLAGVEAYAPTDNVAELTARINDDGWGKALVGWLKVSKLSPQDSVFFLSVGGGDLSRGVSLELVAAVDYAVECNASIFGILGRDGGYVARHAHCVAIVPDVEPSLVTPLSESFQAVFWHAIVSHPTLALGQAHWESLDHR